MVRDEPGEVTVAHTDQEFKSHMNKFENYTEN